jgi:exosortase family protein XrtF
MLKEFKPTILFLVKFFGIYLILSMLYGVFIKSYDEQTPTQLDPITRFITYNSARLTSVLGYETSVIEDDHLNYNSKEEQTFDSLYLSGKYAVSVEEGCNGVNIMILFLAFVVAFGGSFSKMLVFLPIGVFLIHLANLGRLLLLILLNVELNGRGFHFFHKYFFTASIYVAVLLIWYIWVSKLSGRIQKKTPTA